MANNFSQLPKATLASLKREEQGLTLQITGIAVMFISTAYFGVLGNTGKLGLLGLGFLIMIYGSMRLIRKLSKRLIKRIWIGTIGLCVIATIIVTRNQNIDANNGMIFILIVYVYYLSGVIAASSFNIRPYELSSKILPALVAILIGSMLWLRFIRSDAAYSNNGRLTGDESLHPVAVAYILSVCFVLCFTIFWRAIKSPWGIIAGFSLPFLLLGIVATASRGSLLAVMLSLFVFIVVDAWRKQRQSTRKVKPWVKLMFIGVVIGGLAGMLGGSLSAQTEALFIRLSALGDLNTDNSGIERVYIMNSYWRQFDDFWLWGLSGYSSPYPHNMFFEMWLRFGVVGWVLILATFYAVGRAFYNLAVGVMNDWDMIFFTLFFFAVVNGQSNLALEANRVFWFGLGYFLYMPITRKPVSKTSRVATAELVRNGRDLVGPEEMRRRVLVR